ncbi:MAG: long-chain-fatty-acid--CoA ligase [Bryobacteraceae bacterium]
MPDRPYDRKPWLERYPSFVPPRLPPAAESLIDVFERTAARHPDRPALHFFESTCTFAELNGLANRFAARLAAWGVGFGDRVALCLQNDPEFLIALYGAWKRGAIVVPLSPMFKAREMEYHLADSGARVLVSLDELYQANAAPILGRTRVEQVVIAGGLIESLRAQSAATADRIPVAADDLAYLVYTSGTTGNPKGAMCPHGAIAFTSDVFRTVMQIGPDDRILGLAPLFHITGLVAGVALAALTATPLILFHRFDAGEALAQIARWKATNAVAAITAYIALMNHPGARRETLSSFTKCFTGGAPVAPAVVAQFEERLGHYVHNTYGLTECNSPSHVTPLDARGPVDPGSGALSIGLPIPNAEVKILDLTDRDREVPPGEPGELALRGPHIFPGYWNKPDATRDAFHNGFFLTGDIAVMDDRGWFYLVDRKKDMIVASGFKVWPREVEDVLYQHPAVKEAAVIGVPDDYRGESVKAFVALRDGHRATADELIAFCRERMAAYKYPRQVEFLEELPKTPSGKFLRRQLRGL